MTDPRMLKGVGHVMLVVALAMIVPAIVSATQSGITGNARMPGRSRH